MITRWILTVIAIFIMGYITSKVVKKDDIPLEKEILNESELKIDGNTCIGCEICEKAAPDYFEMDKSKSKKVAITKINYIELEDKDEVTEARDKYPVGSIKIKFLSIYSCVQVLTNNILI